MKGYRLTKHVEKIFESPSYDYSEWFGYYNYDTLNSDHSRLICNRIKEDGISPKADLKIEVGYYEIRSGIWHHVGYSDSWNWQQGCMAQWLNDDEIIYNSSENNHHIAIIFNITTGQSRKIDWAIYGITPDGQKSIALDMERAHWCRAYHYESVVDAKKNGRIYEDDGIFEIDLCKNLRKRIISIQDIISLDYRPYFSKAKHWIEHIMINQSGSKFCFLHRFSPIDNVYSYRTRLIIVDMETYRMQCISNWEKMQWSHFGWNGDDFVVYTYPLGENIRESDFDTTTPITCSCNGLISKKVDVKKMARLAVRKIVDRIVPISIEKILRNNKTYYQYYSCNNGIYELAYLIDNKEFLIDGHPSFILEKSLMITDTYPHNNHKQFLYCYNLLTKKVTKLGSFYAYYQHTPASCDLHPKLSRDGKFVVVDSAHDNKHHIIVLKLKIS